MATVLATASARGLDLKAALDHAREDAAVRPCARLSFAERAKLIGAVADVLIANRAKYEDDRDRQFRQHQDRCRDRYRRRHRHPEILCAARRLRSATATFLLDEKPVRLAKAENFQAIHLLAPRHGVAVHINAFNFPSWGLWEKAAVSLLAGVPVLAKPASSTAMLTHAMVRDVIAANVLPEGALSLLCGGAGDLLDHVSGADVIAFTGSSDTAGAHPAASEYSGARRAW